MTIFHQRPERILNRLVRGGLIVPLRGPGGGFVLAKPAAKVTRAEVFSAAGRQELTVPSLHSYCG
ncbi:MAG: Rrf2 family transcriptional regulator, partial [candidate division WOR-3 bacterium]